MNPSHFGRRPNPAKVFARAGLLFLGIALTWTCAAFGLFLMTPHGCTVSKDVMARWQVRSVRDAVATYQIEHGRCPATRDAVIGGDHIFARHFTDPWGTSVAYWCSDDDVYATSAGSDRVFGTADDIISDP
jgi:hypothetical protein